MASEKTWEMIQKGMQCQATGSLRSKGEDEHCKVSKVYLSTSYRGMDGRGHQCYIIIIILLGKIA